MAIIDLSPNGLALTRFAGCYRAGLDDQTLRSNDLRASMPDVTKTAR
jgi:hypothetical protein